MLKRRGSVTLLALVTLAGLNTPATAQENALSMNLGYFAVRGADARIADDVIMENLDLFAFGLDQFNSASIGAEWLVEMGDYIEAGVGVGFSQRTVLSVYSDFVNEDGSEIPQDFKLRVTPFTATARFFPFGLSSSVQPYGGIGIGLFNWRYAEMGEFIDFDTFDVFRDQFVAKGSDVGRLFVVGLRSRMGDRYTIGVEFRYHDASGVVGIDQGFLDERIDLGGLTTSFTFNVSF